MMGPLELLRLIIAKTKLFVLMIVHIHRCGKGFLGWAKGCDLLAKDLRVLANLIESAAEEKRFKQAYFTSLTMLDIIQSQKMVVIPWCPLPPPESAVTGRANEGDILIFAHQTAKAARSTADAAGRVAEQTRAKRAELIRKVLSGRIREAFNYGVRETETLRP